MPLKQESTRVEGASSAPGDSRRPGVVWMPLKQASQTWAEGRSTPTPDSGAPQDRGSDRRRRGQPRLSMLRASWTWCCSATLLRSSSTGSRTALSRRGARSLRPAALRKSALQRGKLRRIGQQRQYFVCVRQARPKQHGALSLWSGGHGAVASTDVRSVEYSTRCYARGRRWHHRWLLGYSSPPI